MKQSRVSDWYPVSKPNLEPGPSKGDECHSRGIVETRAPKAVEVSKHAKSESLNCIDSGNGPGVDVPLQNGFPGRNSTASPGRHKPEDDSAGVAYQDLATNVLPLESASETEGGRQEKLQTKQESWQTKMLPERGFFMSDLPESFHSATLRVRYECKRYASHYRLELPQLEDLFPNGCEDLKEVYSRLGQLKKNAASTDSYEPIEPAIWSSATESEWPCELSLGGMLLFTPKTDSSVLRLKLNPIRLHKKSNRFFRKFGSHRFLRVLVPTTKTYPKHLDQNDLQARMVQWLNVPKKKLLGCSWSTIFMKPSTATNKSVERFGEVEGRDIFLFAESGPRLETISRNELLNWFLPFQLNKQLPACKAYTRLELGFSSTNATIIFKPSQVHVVPTMLGDGASEDWKLNDSSFDWTGVHSPKTSREMNDGCEMISAAAAKQIWTKLQTPGPVPSAFQARIGPWKGIWFVASAPHVGKIQDDDVWIRVNSTQQKFRRHEEDEQDLHFDPLRLSFDVVQWSRKPSTSTFYHEYLPILEDRGVPRDNCNDIVLEWLKTERKEAEQALSHSMRTLEWIQSKRAVLSTYAEGTEWSGSRCKSRSQMVQSLIQSGFNIKTCAHLLQLVQSTMRGYMVGVSNDLRISIPSSTSMIGIADPWACLAPNEISLVFSDAKLVGSPILSGYDVLVSRHPALRASDVQRVHAVCKPELSYLVDVVVFPVTGSYPLASKLQGGDYDGDTFWICWDPRLVTNFQNAPPPAESPKPEKYNIAVDKTACASFLEWGNFADRFLGHCLHFQCQESLLGTCTNYHKRVRYTLNSLRDPGVEQLADMHDLLVDSSKNGYTFSSTAWANWRLQNTRFRSIKPQTLFDEAHGIKLDDENRRKEWEVSSDIIDHLIFKVARAESKNILRDVFEKARKETTTLDAHLSRLYDTVKRDFPEAAGILKDLEARLEPGSHFYEPWKQVPGKVGSIEARYDATEERKSELWDAARRQCRKRFQDIEPSPKQHAISRAWSLKPAMCATSMWDYIKTSALFARWHEKPAFVFAVAGEVICRLKADSIKGTEPVVAPILQRSKIRKRKLAEVDFEAHETALEVEDDISGSEKDFETAHESEESATEGDGGVSLFLPDVPSGSPDPMRARGDTGSTQYSWPSGASVQTTQVSSQTQFESAQQDMFEQSQPSQLHSQLSLR